MIPEREVAYEVMKVCWETQVDLEDFSPTKDGTGIAVRCNDMFFWGGSDLEEITPGNFPRLASTLRELKAKGRCNGEHPILNGPALWVARERKERPQGVMYAHYGPVIRKLMDRCGPKREVGHGNPHPQLEYGS